MNGLRVLHRGQDIQKCFARGDALVVVQPLELDACEAVHGRGMGVARGDVRLAAHNRHSRRGYLTRVVLQQPVLELVLLDLVTGLEQPQPGYLHVQVHLLLDARITSTQRLYFRERKRGLVRVLAGANGRLRGHDLRNKPLLVL